MLNVAFEPAPHRHGVSTVTRPDRQPSSQTARRLVQRAAPSRFTYLPDTTVAYEAAGPLIRTRADGGQPTAWHSAWSSSTLDADAVDAPESLALICRDVHSALVLCEADRICRAFHVDGRRRWRLQAPESAPGGDPPDADALDADQLSITIAYGDDAPSGVPTSSEW
jgi:hypothetical protein